MASEGGGRGGLTRRDAIKGSGGLVAGGLLAGCAGSADAGRAETAGGTAESDTAATAEAAETGTTAGDGSYAVTTAPTGEVTFDAPPETWRAHFSTYGDMGIALGQSDGLKALTYAENRPDEFYDYLPDVDVSLDGVEQIMGENGIDKELFYEFGYDVYLFDPNCVARLDDAWEGLDTLSDEDGWLFDHRRVADVVAGRF